MGAVETTQEHTMSEVTISSGKACLAKGTKILTIDHKEINVEDVQNGDALLGPDGEPRIVSHVVSGKEHLYRIKIGFHKEDLVVTKNHILVMHKRKPGSTIYNGPTIIQHSTRLADQLGVLPVPTSDPADPERENNLVKSRDSFIEALKSAISWALNAERSKNGDSFIRNTLNSTIGIITRQESYLVNLPGSKGYKGKGEWHTYGWGNPNRINLKGHPNHPPIFYATADEALAAAVAKSTEIYGPGTITLATLGQRYSAKSATGDAGELRVDAGLPNIFLRWNKGRNAPKIRVYCSRDYKKYGRSYAFPTMPTDTTHITSNVLHDEHDVAVTDMDEDEDAAPDVNNMDEDEVPRVNASNDLEVSAAEYYDTVKMTVEQLAALPASELKLHRLYRSPGFELPEQQIPINPYFLGLWLGDGTRTTTSIANNHEGPIREFLGAHAAELDLQLVHFGGLAYHTVGKTRLLGRPLPLTRDKAVDDRSVRIPRNTLFKQRLAAGWTWQADRLPGETRIWQAPAHATIKSEESTSNTLASTTSNTLASTTSNTLASTTSNTLADPSPNMPGETSARAMAKHALSRSPGSSPPVKRASLAESVAPLSLGSVLEPGEPEPQWATRDDPVDLLRSDIEFMGLCDANAKANPAEDCADHTTDQIECFDAEEAGLDMVHMIVTDDISDNVANSDDDASSDSADIIIHDVPRGVRSRQRRFMLETGRDEYGVLDNQEQEQLVDSIIESHVEYGSTNKVNTLLHALRGLGVLTPLGETGPAADRKHIPLVYMRNSRDIRLKVLAGLIDSDGWYVWPQNHMGFTQSKIWHSRLFWDVVALARSLGFNVCTSDIMTWVPSRTRQTPQLKAIITGALQDIPCLLLRKQGANRLASVRRSFMVKSVTIEEEDAEWHGFQVDQDQLYLRHDYLVLHNSGITQD